MIQQKSAPNPHIAICKRFMFALVVIFSAMVPAMAIAQDAASFDPGSFSIGLEPFASGFESPVYAVGPNDGSGRLFVLEQAGRIRIVREGEVVPEPFLDIAEIVESGGSEQGLLGLAFPENFAESGAFYVYYTARSEEGVGDNTIARYRVSEDDPDLADPASAEVLLAVPDTRTNHNGGTLQFGPDGYLYAGLGDGGGGGDPDNNGQNPATLLGIVLRIDPSGNLFPYAIPGDNPFADGEGGSPEVWAWGLRNPWRYSFDRATGDLYLGDVGQGAIEEINWLPAGTTGGTNFGWNITEGTRCLDETDCDAMGLTEPVTEYPHDFGCSVVGGYVYRGVLEPELQGVYLFGDFCTGLVWGMIRNEAGEWIRSDPIETGLQISSFGEDANGEVYIVDLAGDLYRVTSEPRASEQG